MKGEELEFNPLGRQTNHFRKESYTLYYFYLFSISIYYFNYLNEISFSIFSIFYFYIIRKIYFQILEQNACYTIAIRMNDL